MDARKHCRDLKFILKRSKEDMILKIKNKRKNNMDGKPENSPE